MIYLHANSWWQVAFMGDFTVHGDYWGGLTDDSCFRKEALTRLWLPEPAGTRREPAGQPSSPPTHVPPSPREETARQSTTWTRPTGASNVDD